jgi:hypothetical protein
MCRRPRKRSYLLLSCCPLMVLLFNGSSVWLPSSDRVPLASRSQELYCGCVAVGEHVLFSGFKCGWGELEVGLYHTVADAAERLYRMIDWFTVTTYPLLISYNTWTQIPLDFPYFLSVSDWTCLTAVSLAPFYSLRLTLNFVTKNRTS